MGPSTGVSLTPPLRRGEWTSSTRFRVGTSIRWKFIVPARTCHVCSLFRFDGKKWCFSAFPTVQAHCRSPTGRSSTVFKRSASIKMTGPSHAVCNNGCDLHFRWDRYRDAPCYAHVAQALDLSSMHAPLFGLRGCLNFFGQGIACSTNTTVKVLYSTVATAQLAVLTKTESSGFVGNLIHQRHSRCRILSQNVLLSTNDRAFARRVSSVTCTTWVRKLHTPKSMVHDLSEEDAHPKINVLHLPQHLSQLEARNTDDDNA